MNIGDKPSIQITEQPVIGFPLLEVHYDADLVSAIRKFEAEMGIPPQPISPELIQVIYPAIPWWRRLWRFLNMDIRDIWRLYIRRG